MSKIQQTEKFGKIMTDIRDELKEGNPKFTQVIKDALSKDGTLAMKVAYPELAMPKDKPQ
jgi:hypothetical protein